MTRTIRRILLAVDPSKPRDAAFDRALLLARRSNAALYLLHTRPPRAASRFDVPGEALELEPSEAWRSRLRALVHWANDDGVQVEVISAHGDAGGAMAAYAHLVAADLIVIGRDFGSPRMWRSPRVAAAVGRSAPVPVLIVPPRRAAPHSPEMRFEKVVVAVDFTVASAVALRVATDVIARSDGRGTVVHAVSYAVPLVFSGREAWGLVDDLRGQLAEAEERLRRTIPAGASHRVKLRVVAGKAGQAILDVAAEVEGDLVVMGVPRRNRLDELLLRSTFQHVIRRSKRPILAVPVAAGAYRWAGERRADVVSQRYVRAA